MSGNRRRKARRTKLLIIIMLLMCVVAACGIIVMQSHNGKTAQADEPEVTEAADAADDGEETAEEAAEGTQGIADAHVYSYFGPPGGNEFSIDAYDSAVAAGSKNIRAAMVVSSDGIAYVAEDDHSLDMTGYDGYFSGMVESQISNLTTKSGQKVLKLKDLFDKYGDSVTYIIDIKYIGSRNIEAFVKAVRLAGIEDNVIAASASLDNLSLADEYFSEMPKLYMCSDQATFSAALERDYVDTICVTKDLMSEENLKSAHDSGKKLGASLLNSEEDISKAIGTGMDFYFTDDTELAISLEEKNRID